MNRRTVSKGATGVSGLATDLYQLTMAAGYHHHRMGETRGTFHLFFRRPPFGGGYAVAAGLGEALERLQALSFSADDLAYLRSLHSPAGAPLFDEAFLARLGRLRVELDIDAVPEGTVVFAGEPLLRVTGDILSCQLVETVLLAIVGHQTLVATKAARIKRAAGGRPVLELGFRRAHGEGAALSASRAAFVGGVDGTSNVLAGRIYGIPVRGTHAHSWVMAFGDERRAFEAYAEAMPSSVVFLVDTYGTESGIENAIEVATQMRERGQSLSAIRLDSGDLAALARVARERLDDAGLEDVQILASNDLDEHAISDLVAAGAPIDAFGVGTRLVTGGDQPALGAVYKLGAIEEGGVFRPRMKLSSDAAKSSLPGRIGVLRHRRNGRPTHDVLYDVDARASTPIESQDGRDSAWEELLKPVMRRGELVAALPSLRACRARALEEVSRLPSKVARPVDPLRYSVLLDEGLASLREWSGGRVHREKAS